MEKFLSDLLKYIFAGFHTFRALISGVFFQIILYSHIDNFIAKAIPEIWVRFLIYGLMHLIWILLWFRYRYDLPRNKKNKIGIVIAISAENDLEEQRVRNDFIVHLAQRLKECKVNKVINLITIDNHQVLRLNLSDKESVLALHKKVGGHFYIYGMVRKRKDAQETYFINLNGLVSHKPVDLNVSKALSIDFRKVLPGQIAFLESLEFRGFIFSADMVYLAVRYVTGIAAFISGDPILAHDFHENLQVEFNRFRPLPPDIRTIRDRSTLLLSDEEFTIAKNLFFSGDLKQSRLWLDMAIQTNPNNYGAWLLMAIFDFRVDQNPIAALKSIKKAERYSKSTFEWRYSKAFLYFWLCKYDRALKVCRDIAQQTYNGEDYTIKEVEQFVLNILFEYPKKIQLYYWVGYISYKKAANFPKALEYLEKFEKECDASMLILKQRSTAYLREIKNIMGLK